MKDIFDILGISSREDSYTDLIANGFNDTRHEMFRKNVVEFFGGNHRLLNGVTLETRKVFSIEGKTKGKRNKVLPDMVLYFEDTKKVVLIENKIFSSEGYHQTIDYASKDVKEAIVSEYKKSNKEVQSIDYYFMTLLGDVPESNDFKIILWSDFIMSTISGCHFMDSYSAMFSDLQARASHLSKFNELQLIGSSYSISELVRLYNLDGEKWVNSKTIFRKWMSSVNERIQEKYSDIIPWMTMASGRSAQYLSLFTNPKWEAEKLVSKEVKENKYTIDEIAETKNIHIEFNWSAAGRAVLFIHYEPNPYFSEKEFRKLSAEGYKLYKKARDKYKIKFHNTMNENGCDYFRVTNSKLALAKYEFSKSQDFRDMTYKDFEAKILGAFDEGYNLINQTNESILLK